MAAGGGRRVSGVVDVGGRGDFKNTRGKKTLRFFFFVEGRRKSFQATTDDR